MDAHGEDTCSQFVVSSEIRCGNSEDDRIRTRFEEEDEEQADDAADAGHCRGEDREQDHADTVDEEGKGRVDVLRRWMEDECQARSRRVGI